MNRPKSAHAQREALTHEQTCSELVKVLAMNQGLTPTTALLLTLSPLLWAGNAVVGRLVSPLVPPMTLNLLRWALALLVLPLLLQQGGNAWVRIVDMALL